jgi:hypothetical protein
MKSKTMCTCYFISMFILLVTITTTWILDTHAQSISIKNISNTAIKIKPLENNINISIITPWNTGNDRNSSSSNIDRNG